jgi:hypothetical protein
MEKAFDKLLPIPKTPRVYHPPPPARPLSWVPHGTLGNGTGYEERLADFALEIQSINRQRTHPIKFSSRGWCYALEGLNKITKDEFGPCQKAINDCRKIGYLPIDFVAEDQDETRRFQGIHEAASPEATLRRIGNDVKEALENLASSITDYWKGETSYVMMCVEKGDILNLFKPICQEYHVPIINSKGWPPILLRSHIADLCQIAEERSLTPILLLFYDHDPAGLKISDKFKELMKDCQEGTGYDPEGMIIERFGLNAEDIDRYNLTWIPNLRTGSGRESRDYNYIQKFGNQKCESNALFKNDDTLKAGEQICRNAIEKYYGKDALERFKQREQEAENSLGTKYSLDEWLNLATQMQQLIQELEEEEETEEDGEGEKPKPEVEVFLDDKYYGSCPKCGYSFDYTEDDSGKVVVCRHCNTHMRLRWKPKKTAKAKP